MTAHAALFTGFVRSWLGFAICFRGAEYKKDFAGGTGHPQHFAVRCWKQELRGNRQMVRGALQENGLMLEHAAEDLRGPALTVKHVNLPSAAPLRWKVMLKLPCLRSHPTLLHFSCLVAIPKLLQY